MGNGRSRGQWSRSWLQLLPNNKGLQARLEYKHVGKEQLQIDIKLEEKKRSGKEEQSQLSLSLHNQLDIVYLALPRSLYVIH